MNKAKTMRSAPGPAGVRSAGTTAPVAWDARPLREILRHLPKAMAMEGVRVDAASANGELLDRLAASAEASMKTIHLGLGALGHLVARSSLDIEDGSVPAECVESLGFLMAELGDLAAECMRIASDCRSASRAGEISSCEK